jgi:hypothetical protein
MSFISQLLDAFHRLFPSTRLLDYEQLCLHAWRGTLTESAKRVLDAQIGTAYFVQRQANGARVCFFYPARKEMQLFRDQSPDLHVATVVLRSHGGSNLQTMRVKIYVHRGRFFSIEFPKRPERYWEQHSMQGLPLDVERVDIHHELIGDE